MAIEIYSCVYDPKRATVVNKLTAVAPLEDREQVEVWCSQKNKEAKEAGVARRFTYSITDVEIWSFIE